MEGKALQRGGQNVFRLEYDSDQNSYTSVINCIANLFDGFTQIHFIIHIKSVTDNRNNKASWDLRPPQGVSQSLKNKSTERDSNL